MDPQTLIARRVARELRPGNLVNLGIGIPTLVANYVPPELKVFFQSENGLIGTGPIPEQGMAHPLLTDAGGRPISALPGASTFDSSMSFALIRGGHVDVTVLGGLQVDAEGRLALRAKGSPKKEKAKALIPWFEAADARWRGSRIVFGHWSTLGYFKNADVTGIDTGCVWGDMLTAIRIDVPDAKPVQVGCKRT